MLHFLAEVGDGLITDDNDTSAGKGEGLHERGLGVHCGRLPGALD